MLLSIGVCIMRYLLVFEDTDPQEKSTPFHVGASFPSQSSVIEESARLEFPQMFKSSMVVAGQILGVQEKFICCLIFYIFFNIFCFVLLLLVYLALVFKIILKYLGRVYC